MEFEDEGGNKLIPNNKNKYQMSKNNNRNNKKIIRTGIKNS